MTSKSQQQNPTHEAVDTNRSLILERRLAEAEERIAGLERENQALRQSLNADEDLAAQFQQHAVELGAAIDAMVEAVLIYSNKGVIKRVNASAIRLCGFDPTGMERVSLMGRLSIRRPDDSPVDPDRLPSSRALRGEIVSGERLRLTNPKGDQFIILVSSSPVFACGKQSGVVTVWQSITEVEKAAADLRESEERFRQLADSMPQLVWTARPDGTVDYYNRRYHEYSGIAPGEAWGWEPVLHPDDLQKTMDAWEQALETGGIYQVEHRVRMASGEYRWHLSRGIPARDAQGQITKWFGTATDIHEPKLVEQRLERSNRDLEEFAFVASHDLQEPLRKIKGFAESVRRRLQGKLDEDTQDHFARMLQAVERMQGMITDLLNLSRVSMREMAFTSVDMTQVLIDVITDLEPRLQSTGGEVRLGELPQIEADPAQMRQLLQNLIGNALKYHQENIPPVVHVTSQPRAGSEGGENLPAEWVEIVIEDNGIGFDEHYAEQIFQPFRRLHGRSQYEGTGMGLAISRKIVERHGGKVSVSSQVGQGSRFSVLLPVKQNASPPLGTGDNEV